MPNTTHKPDRWVIVSHVPLIVTAMCKCCDDNCHYTAEVSEAVNTNLNELGTVKLPRECD